MTTKEETTLDITILRPTFLKGEPLEVGKTIRNVLKKDAIDLIGAQKAKEVELVTEADKAEIKATEDRLKEKETLKKGKNPPEIARIHRSKGGNAKTAAETQALKEKKATAAKLTADLSKKTNAELQAILEDMVIDYETDANKARLVELIVESELA